MWKPKRGGTTKMPEKKKARRWSWTSGAVLQNPVLVQASGITAIIVAATSLQGAIWISLLTALHLIICEVLASAALKRVPGWLRVAIYFAIGLLITCPATYVLDHYYDFFSSGGLLAPLRIFLPLLSVSALIAMRCERYAILHTPSDALRDALSNSLGYFAAAALTGAVRELLGYGSIWGVQITDNLHIRGAWMPFGGFLILGAIAALLKVLLRALSARGIYAGADKALELAPEDRLERLEKTRQLLISDVKAALEKQEAKQAKAEKDDKEEKDIKDDDKQEIDDGNTAADTDAPEPEEAAEQDEAPPEPEEEAQPVAPRMPVEAILREYGLLDQPAGLLEDPDDLLETLDDLPETPAALDPDDAAALSRGDYEQLFDPLPSRPLTEEEKEKLARELEELLNEFGGGDRA